MTDQKESSEDKWAEQILGNNRRWGKKRKKKVAAYIGEIVLGEEDLSDGLIELAEEIVVETHESSLTHSSNGLVPIKNVRNGFKRKAIKKIEFYPGDNF